MYDKYLAELARKWSVEAVGREYPHHVRRPDGYRYVRGGKWYVIRDGQQVRASAAQSRELNKAGAHLSAYGSIGPVYSESP